MKPTTILKIQSWLLNPDYDTGVAILSTIRPQMARIIAGRPHRYTNKLHYELSKIVGTPNPSEFTKPDGVPQSTTPPINQSTNPPINQSTNQPINQSTTPPINQSTNPPIHQSTNPPIHQPTTASQSPILTHSSDAPELINQISKEHLRLITLRSQLAEQRSQVPQTNTPANNKKRKTLTQAIHEASDRIEELFNAHSHYMKTKTLPDIQIASPSAVPEPVEGTTAPTASQHHSNTASQKQRTNLMKAIQKIKTQLDYNDTKKAKKKNPMPRGPKRTKLEQSLKEKQLQLKQIVNRQS